MKRTLFKAVIATALLSMTALAAQAQDSLKIGYVNGERVMRESNLAKAAQAKLEGEFGKREKELTEMDQRRRSMAEKADKEAATLSDAQRKSRQREFDDLNVDYQRKLTAYQEDLNRRKNEELQNISERANRVIKQIFDADKYDLIIQDVAFVSPRVDITKKVIDALNLQK